MAAHDHMERHEPKTSRTRAESQNLRERSLTELDVLRQRFEEATSMLKVIMECSSNVIVSADLNGNITSLSATAERTLGYAAAEVVGNPISNYLPPEQFAEFTHNVGIVRQGHSVDPYRTQRRRKDGTTVDILTKVVPLKNTASEVVGIVAVAQDLTEVLRLEQQFVLAQKMDAIGQLASGIAHDFNNLLTVINGYSELLLHDLDPEGSVRELVAEIYNAGQRAGTLTRQLLAFSRQQALEPRAVDLNAVVGDTEKMLRRLVGEDIVSTFKPQPALLTVKVDASGMQQALINLVVNARDAMPHGGSLTIETANVRLDESYGRKHPDVRPGDYALLAVTDTGIGMDEKTKARVFEPFFTTKEPGKGTGLGLAMAYGIIKQSGGSIDVESELGHGATFKVLLPLVQQSVSPAVSFDSLHAAPRGNESVLLVEDDDAVRAFAGHVLRTCGYTVREATNGKEAIRLAEGYSRPIHIVVSDVVMPDLGGLEMTKRLRTMTPGLKALFLSGYTDDAVIRHGVLRSEVALLQKPFTAAGLARKVREVLDAIE